MGGQHTCATCPADYYAEEGNAYCTPVPPGFRINDANDGLTVCLHKTYSDWGDTTCTTCKDGFLCPLAHELMGLTAERLAEQYDISRQEQDEAGSREGRAHARRRDRHVLEGKFEGETRFDHVQLRDHG